MLYFVTGNQHKIDAAKKFLSPLAINFEAVNVPLIEIQSTSIEEIARDKAQQAYKKLHMPLIIKEDGWHISALNGFPGPYMKYVNEWLTVADYQNLLRSKENKKVIFTEVICYIDKDQTNVFTGVIEGYVLEKPAGKANHPFMELVTFRQDGLSMAEAASKNLGEFDRNIAWEDFTQWYSKQQ
jgi:XTP/dITP diphosphohydrolase